MQEGLYISLAGQVARERRLTTIAENIANSQTVGYKATQVRFEEVVQQVEGSQVSYTGRGVEYVDDGVGSLEQTGNPLDFAIRGNAWFAIQTPAGPVVTRDGRFTMANTGDLVTLAGYPVLDPGGAPIVLDPGGGIPELGQDGFIRQNGRQVAAIGLFAFEPGPGFQRFENSGIVVGGDPEPIVDNGLVGIVQGHLENSNVNALKQITELIVLQRTFEQAASLTQLAEQSMEKLIGAMSAT